MDSSALEAELVSKRIASCLLTLVSPLAARLVEQAVPVVVSASQSGPDLDCLSALEKLAVQLEVLVVPAALALAVAAYLMCLKLLCPSYDQVAAC